ncbi:uncharacterized protein LOC125765945 [Anopheles funestus]|uniref:uncharacterized protein LOC125765945 n=1 Tax=Anopheles funestus TaxID=62324 RepID=UPI0020C5DF07|nr:uncharacterized protein LOC125765945 [Anopheles funestus]
MDFRKTISTLLLLWGSLQGYAKISTKVISLQQVLYTELQTLERSALVTHPLQATPGESALGRLRTVFHEFEHQNQESITTILRVLALVDHTLENTIQDCEKVFHLPSLDSANVLFRDVTRPLLLRVETLCQQIASGSVDEIESTMVTVEREANSYRKRLDETKRNMQIVLHALDNSVEIFSLSNEFDVLFEDIERINSTIRESILTAANNLLTKQRLIGDEILQLRGTNDDADMYAAITNFMKLLDNETELLVEDLAEQLNDWFNQTADMFNLVQEEIRNIPRELMEYPMESFLQHETSLKCLAECSNQNAVEKIQENLESILQCFNIANDTERPFELVYHHLSQTADNVQLVMQDILHCHQSTFRDGYDVNDLEDIPSCFALAQSILDAMEDFMESRMDEISFHVDLSMYYNELKMETCVFYRAREMMLSVSSLNHHYRKCNMANEIEL